MSPASPAIFEIRHFQAGSDYPKVPGVSEGELHLDRLGPLPEGIWRRRVHKHPVVPLCSSFGPAPLETQLVVLIFLIGPYVACRFALTNENAVFHGPDRGYRSR